MAVPFHGERLPNFIKAFGSIKGMTLYGQIYVVPKRGTIFAVKVAGSKIWLRPTPSDTSIFFQIFVKREYETKQWPEQDAVLSAKYDAILASGRTPVIIDAGANIGLSSRWYCERYSKAAIVAVEPDDDNFVLLQKNVADRPNVSPIQGAVWDRSARVKIANPNAGAGALRVVECANDVGLRAYSVPELLAMVPNGALFIAKIDIEGGEAALFRSNTEWVSEAAMLTVELHDWMLPRQGTSQHFLETISRLPCDFLARGENVFVFSTTD